MASFEKKSRKLAAISSIRVVEEVLRRWDPIGIEPGVHGPADEYDSYAPHIVSMVARGCTAEQLAAHLEHLAVSVIGMGSNEIVSRQFAKEILQGLKP